MPSRRQNSPTIVPAASKRPSTSRHPCSPNRRRLPADSICIAPHALNMSQFWTTPSREETTPQAYRLLCKALAHPNARHMKQQLVGNQAQQHTGFGGEVAEDLEAQRSELLAPVCEHRNGGQGGNGGWQYAKQPESYCLQKAAQVM